MSTITSNTYRRYKLGTEAMFTWLSEALDKTGITVDTRLEDTSIRSKHTRWLCPSHWLLPSLLCLPRMKKDDSLLTDTQTS